MQNMDYYDILLYIKYRMINYAEVYLSETMFVINQIENEISFLK